MEARIDHIALYTLDLERAAAFWTQMFSASVGEPYHSARRPGFVSRFVTLPGGVRIEVMTAPWIEPAAPGERLGWDHIAIALGSRAAVDALAARAAEHGCLAADPRETGDGFYEAVLQAFDGTRVEITG